MNERFPINLSDRETEATDPLDINLGFVLSPPSSGFDDLFSDSERPTLFSAEDENITETGPQAGQYQDEIHKERSEYVSQRKFYSNLSLMPRLEQLRNTSEATQAETDNTAPQTYPNTPPEAGAGQQLSTNPNYEDLQSSTPESFDDKQIALLQVLDARKDSSGSDCTTSSKSWSFRRSVTTKPTAPNHFWDLPPKPQPAAIT